MELRSCLYGVALLLAGCAHQPTSKVSPSSAPKLAAPSEETKSQRVAAKIALGFDPAFAHPPKNVDQREGGLRTEDFQVGTGVPAQVGSELTVRFVGYLEDGTVFDQNADPSQPPFRFALPERPRVQGWGLGLQGMRAGGVRKIVVPPALAYGAEGDPADDDVPAIPPNSTLTYLVKVIEVEPPLAGP